MTIDTKKKVGEIAAEVPGAVKILDAWGVDYCCGGDRSFDQACATAGVPLRILRDTFEMEILKPVGDGSSFRDWSDKNCSDIIQYILREHHAYTREQGRRLKVLASKVVSAHGKEHPDLLRIKPLLEGVVHLLEEHMSEEEEAVFPLILGAEKAAAGKDRWRPPARTEANLEVLQEEHVIIGREIHKLLHSAHGFLGSSGGCGFQREFYDGLQDLEKDLHHHIHLENNILFRRVREAGIFA